MVKRNRGVLLWIAATAAVMLLLPWLAVTFVKGDAGMAVCFLLFYALNPVYSVAAGIYAGKNSRQLWCLPVVTASLFLAGTWIFFDMGEPAFMMYAGIYFILGMCAMLGCVLIRKRCSAGL